MCANFPKQLVTSSALQDLQLVTNDYIKGKAGFYMTLEGFSNSRKCERMVAQIKFPVPLHLLERDNVVYWKANGKINNDLQFPFTCSIML